MPRLYGRRRVGVEPQVVIPLSIGARTSLSSTFLLDGHVDSCGNLVGPDKMLVNGTTLKESEPLACTEGLAD